MRSSEIVVGGIYHDGKVGVREIVAIDDIHSPSADAPQVTYRILAAKVGQEYSYAEKKVIPVIGTESKCNLSSFSQWAKLKVADADSLLTDLAARKLKLPPGEKTLMLSMSKEIDGAPAAGTVISFSFNEIRQVRGLEKKGLVTVDQPRSGSDGEVTLTPLGAAWMNTNLRIPPLKQR